MKKVLAISCLVVVFTITMAAMASAADNNWRFNLLADNGDLGADSWAAMTIGVYSGATYVSKDGNYSDSLWSDAADGRFDTTVGKSTTRAVVGVFKGTYPDTTVGDMAWIKDIKSPRYPANPPYPASGRKVWDLRVAGMSTASTDKPIRLVFLTIGATNLPPSTVSSKPVLYWLKMVDNKGQGGAYANGTIWSIPIPTSHLGTPYFTLTLPMLNTTGFSEANLLSEGYKMEFYQTPEPSSLMALGAGLMALGGLASRKRRK